MKTITRVVVPLFFAGFTFLHTATAAPISQTPTVTQTQQKTSLLFVMRADMGVINKTDTGYTLTLQGMDDKVLYFSDRPVRKAGFVTMTQFMDNWTKGKSSFQANPPNAAIVYANLNTNDKGVAQAIPVELKNPVATKDGWTFHLNDLQGKISIGSYNKISIFIDNYGCNDGGGNEWYGCNSGFDI